MNKKILGSLVGGGVTAVVASLGGVKLNDTLDFNKKVNYFGGISKRFSNKSPSELKNYYLPKWEDEALWKRQHSILQDKKPEQWPTPASFRDWCYKKAEEDPEVTSCNGTHGWCVDCIRDKEWDK